MKNFLQKNKDLVNGFFLVLIITAIEFVLNRIKHTQLSLWSIFISVFGEIILIIFLFRILKTKDMK